MMMVTLGLEARYFALLESGLRVKARISMGMDEGEKRERRASRTAPPCLPVAPVIRNLRAAISAI